MLRALFQSVRRLPVAPPVCFGLAWLLMQTEPMRQFEWRTLDWRTSFRAFFQPPPDPRIALILFEDNTEASISWPPDRSVHGDFISLLTYARPAVISFDVILDAIRDGEGDAKMGLSVREAAKAGVAVITAGVTSHDPVEVAPGPAGPTEPFKFVEGDLGRLVGDSYAVVPFPQLRAASLYGFADTPPGADGIRREIPLVIRVGDKAYPSLALQTAMAFYHVRAGDVRVRLGDAIYLPVKPHEIRVPISAAGTFLLNYRYDQDDLGPDFPTYGYLEALVKLNDRFLEKKTFAPAPPRIAGDIVLVGQTVTGKADIGPSPRNAYAPLVLVHANVLNNVLAGDYARRAPPWAVWLGAVALGYAGVSFGVRRTLAFNVAFTVLSLALYGVTAYAAWIAWSLWLPLTGPVLGFTVLQFMVTGRRVLQEQRARERVKQMFGSYLSPHLVARMVESGETPQLGGHEEEITAYFSDIQGFSGFSEKMSPARLVELMNEYLNDCTDIVQEEGGTLDKYIGDAVVVMFGAPIALPDHAYRACVATLRVQQRLGELRAKWTAEGDKWPAIVRQMQSRIGLNTGRCIVGNMGSRARFNYTMMGDDVNLAARMESGAKSWGVYTMCTEATKLACERHGGDRVVFRALGRIVVKGRERPVPIFEIVGLRENLGPETHECIGVFAQGLAKYHARDWDAAIALFCRSAELEWNVPGRTAGVTANPSLIYIDIARHCKNEPLPPDWDGVYIMQEK